jgi:secreted trypsin-like serine protease
LCLFHLGELNKNMNYAVYLYMKNVVFVTLLFLCTLSAMSQKVHVQVMKPGKEGKAEWQVLDFQKQIVASSNDFFSGDTAIFSLDADTKYTLKISVYEVSKSDTPLYLLLLENEPIILVSSGLGEGDHDYTFFTGTRTRETKITGGVSTSITFFPWQIYYMAGSFRCGGSILSPDWVVTAAHCTKDENENPIPVAQMSVKVGSNNPGNSANLNNTVDGKRYFVSQVIVHEGYSSQTLLNDIALLKIAGPIDFPNAVPIKRVSQFDVEDGAIIPGVMSWVTGWGKISVTPSILPTSLQKVQLPIVSNIQAQAVWGPIPATDLMAGFLNGNKDACNGDSGGPLVVPVLGEYKLAGIVSWGSENCNTYGGYTRVSDFDTWISTKTGLPTAFVPPTPVGDSIVCQGVLSSQYSIADRPPASSYEWKLFPADAGVITGNAASASVMWNLSKTGTVAVMVRVTINNILSDWSYLNVNIVSNTRLLSQSGNNTLCEGLPVTLKVGAEGYNLTYKWSQNGQVVQSGTSSQISFLSSLPSNSGTYICEISGSCGTIFSLPMTLTVHPLTRITFISPDVKVPFGNDITLAVKSEGYKLTYQWLKDGQFLVNRNDSTLLLQDLNATDIGLYQTIVKGECGTKTSDTVYVYVKKANSSVQTEAFVWPTITTTSFNVALSDDLKYTIMIFNQMGRLVKEQTNCRFQTSIEMNGMAQGLYIIRVFNNRFSSSIKIFKR